MSTQPPVTIFIHGTLPPQPVLHIPLVGKFFHCPNGLVKLSDLDTCHTKDILTTLCKQQPNEFPQEHCYTFGWSGTLQHEARKEAAMRLYTELEQLKHTYAQKNKSPELKLLTHSHGGNVALYLKKAADKYGHRADLTIKELILLACPVQIETADYINGSMFNKVFSIHSHLDLLQVMDPQGVHTFLEYLKNFGLEFTLANLKELGPLFSERHFPKNSPVKQLNVRYSHRELLHIEFLLPTFMSALPELIEKIRDHTGNKVNDHDDLTHVFSGESS